MIYQLVENINILLKLKIIIAIWKINIDIFKCVRCFFSGKKLMILLKKGNNNVAISTSIISQYNWHFYMRDRYLSLNAPSLISTGVFFCLVGFIAGKIIRRDYICHHHHPSFLTAFWSDFISPFQYISIPPEHAEYLDVIYIAPSSLQF